MAHVTDSRWHPKVGVMVYVDGRFPLRCERCNGRGEVRGHPLCPDGCTYGGRLHGFGDAECPDNCINGLRRCRTCEDAPAVGIDVDGWESCTLCLDAEREELEALSRESGRHVRALILGD